MSAPTSPSAETRRALQVSAPIERFFGYYPGVVSVITAQLGNDRNVMAAGWHAALSAQPPLYGVALGRDRYTHRLVVESGVFALHFLPFELSRSVAAVGATSRRDGTDKFERFFLDTAPGAELDVPILQDAYLAYECRVTAVHETGDHDWLVGEVVAVHHDPEAFDERLLQDSRTVPGAIYYGRSVYERIGQGQRMEFSPGEFRLKEPAG